MEYNEFQNERTSMVAVLMYQQWAIGGATLLFWEENERANDRTKPRLAFADAQARENKPILWRISQLTCRWRISTSSMGGVSTDFSVDR
jgi:hypothetical protein